MGPDRGGVRTARRDRAEEDLGSGPRTERASEHSATAAQDAQVTETQKNSTIVEWVNYLARSHHGAMGAWDPWAESNGGNNGDFPTDRAVPVPETAEEGVEATSRDVDPAGVGDLMDGDQRSLEDSPHGILEIFLWHESDGSFSRYTEYAEHGLRLDGVSGYAKKALRKMGTVGAVPLNKIIRVYSAHTSDLVPPKEWFSILVTADGYVRQSTVEGDDRFLGLSKAAADVANAISLSNLR